MEGSSLISERESSMKPRLRGLLEEAMEEQSESWGREWEEGERWEWEEALGARERKRGEREASSERERAHGEPSDWDDDSSCIL